MKLSALDLAVIADTLHGSTSIQDGGSVFRYKEKIREDIMKKIHVLMKDIEVEITQEKEAKQVLKKLRGKK